MTLSSPSPTDTVTATATPAPSATIDPNGLYLYSTLAASGQQVAIIYTVTAGEVGLGAIDLSMLLVLLFIAFLLMVRGRQ